MAQPIFPTTQMMSAFQVQKPLLFVKPFEDQLQQPVSIFYRNYDRFISIFKKKFGNRKIVSEIGEEYTIEDLEDLSETGDTVFAKKQEEFSPLQDNQKKQNLTEINGKLKAIRKELGYQLWYSVPEPKTYLGDFLTEKFEWDFAKMPKGQLIMFSFKDLNDICTIIKCHDILVFRIHKVNNEKLTDLSTLLGKLYAEEIVSQKKKGFLEKAISAVERIQTVTKGEIFWRKLNYTAKKFGIYSDRASENKNNLFVTSVNFIKLVLECEEFKQKATTEVRSLIIANAKKALFVGQRSLVAIRSNIGEYLKSDNTIVNSDQSSGDDKENELKAEDDQPLD